LSQISLGNTNEMSTLTLLDSTLFEFSKPKQQWIEKASGEVTFSIDKDLAVSIDDHHFIVQSHIQPKGPSAIAMRVTTNESQRKGTDLIIAVRFARELDCRHLFNHLRAPWLLDNSSHYRSTLQNRRVVHIPPWFLRMDLSQQHNIRLLVSRAETKMLEDGIIQRQLAGIYKFSPVQIDELINFFQPCWRGASGGGPKRHRRQYNICGYENCALPSLYNAPLSRPDMTPPIFQPALNTSSFVAGAGCGSRQYQAEVARAQQLPLEYLNNVPKLNKNLQEDHATIENPWNPGGNTRHQFNPGQNIVANQRWNFQGNFTPPVFHTNRDLSYPTQHFRRSRLSPTVTAQRQRARHLSLMTPEGTYTPFEKFTRARTPSAQIFLHPELSYSPAERFSNQDARLHIHPNQKQPTGNTMSNIFQSPTENTHELNLDTFNSQTINKTRNLIGRSEGKLSDTAIFSEILIDEESKKPEKTTRCTSAPLGRHTSYPLTLKNLASYNKQVVPIKGDYKTIVRRWLNKSI